MRVLLDQGTPAPLRGSLAAHVVSTAFEMGWPALSNGDLLDAAGTKRGLTGNVLDGSCVCQGTGYWGS